MELLQLKYFKIVAETGKLTSAAGALYISPPALSASIARLERELGFKLFDRSSKSISLNKQGEIYLHYINHFLTTLENACLEVQNSVEHKGDRLSLAATSSNIFLDLICAFTLENPQITISHSSVSLPQIRNGDLSLKNDFILAAQEDLESRNLHSVELFEDRLALMVHSTHPYADRSSVDLHEFIGQTLFAPVAEQSLGRMLNELFKLAGLTPKGIIESSYMVRRSMVLAQRGISISTMRAGKAESDPHLRYVPISNPEYHCKQFLFWHHKKVQSGAELLFRNFTLDFYHKNSLASE